MTSMWTSMQLCNRALGRRRTVDQQREAEERDAWFREQVQIGVASVNETDTRYSSASGSSGRARSRSAIRRVIWSYW